MRYINLRFTYLLTYLLTKACYNALTDTMSCSSHAAIKLFTNYLMKVTKSNQNFASYSHSWLLVPLPVCVIQMSV